MRRALALRIVAGMVGGILAGTAGGACDGGATMLDAAPPAADGPLGLVRVRYGGPNPRDQRVLFQAADSSIILATRTDATGRANAYMAAGGFATIVAIEPGSTPNLYTWAGVKPGDDLVVDDGGFVASAPTHPVTLSVPRVDTAETYRMFSRCTTTPGISGGIDVTSATFAPTVEYMFDCDNSADLLVIPNASTLQYLFAHAADIRSAVSLAAPYRAFDTSSVFVDHIPPGWTSVSINRALLDRGVAYYVASAAPAVGPEHQIADNPRFPLPPDALLRVDIAPLVQTDGMGRLHAAHWGPPQPITRFDLGAVALRPFTSHPMYDDAAHAIRWTEGDGQLPDAAIVEWAWTQPETLGRLDWLIVAPRDDEPVIRLPLLPADLRPDLSQTMPQISGLATFAISGGYDATRSHMLDSNAFDQFPAVGPAGDVVTLQLTN